MQKLTGSHTLVFLACSFSAQAFKLYIFIQFDTIECVHTLFHIIKDYHTLTAVGCCNQFLGYREQIKYIGS